MRIFDKVSYEKMALILIVGVAFFFRIYELPSKFFHTETNNIFSGIRLHVLDFFNFSDHMSQNFFKSFFGNIGGIRYTLTTYVSSTIYGWLGIPLNEFWFPFFTVVLGVLSVVGVYWLGCKLGDYRYGLVGAVILAINSDQVHRSREDNAGLTITFLVLICVIFLYLYQENPNWFRRTLLSLILPFLASTEAIMMLPLIIIFQLMLFVPPENSYSRKVFACFRYLFSKDSILLWLPCFFTVLLHVYVYTRIGESNVGLFGYMVYKHGSFYNERSLFAELILNLKIYGNHYFNPQFFYSSLALFIYLASDYKKNKLGKLLLFSGVGFFYFFIVFVISGSNPRSPHLYVCETFNVLFIASIWISLLDRREEILFSKGKLLIICGLLVFFLAQMINQYKNVMARHGLVHPLKSIGYYIHEYGGGNPTAYLLNRCSAVLILANSEFYFATQVIDMEERFDNPRKLFCMGTKSIDETLAAYKLKDFDFYVAVYGYSALDMHPSYQVGIFEKSKPRNPYNDLRNPEIDLQIKDLLANGVKRVAVIKNKGSIMGEIFSRRKLPFKDIEISVYDPLWDQKYANISSIIKTKWVGQWAIWGNLWDFSTGIQLGKE